jgi:PPM family protein phosphatase
VILKRKPPFRYAGATDRGKVRESNEDAFLATAQVLAVADGMGGHAAGEVAARITTDTLARALRQAKKGDPADALTEAIKAANETIIDRANEDNRYRGMGTTVTAAVLRGNVLTIGHVGDSRAYVLSGGVLHQITEDHSLVGEMVREGLLSRDDAAVHPQRSVITRALGASRNLEVDIVERELEPGDKILLATDGLTSVLADSALERTLAQDAPPLEAANRLVEQANARGGPDNITAVVIDYKEPVPEAAARPATRLLIGWTIAFLVLAAALAAGTRSYLSRSYFLGFSGDQVAVYQGIPGSVLGIRLSKVEHLTTVARDQLLPMYRQRVAGTIPVSGPSDAVRVIAEMTAPLPTLETTPTTPIRPGP